MERQEKKEQFEQPRKKSFLPLILVAVFLLIATGAGAWFLQGRSAGEGRVTARDGKITVPLSKISDGKAHFFTYSHNGTDIRFFLLKSHDGAIRAALDTCDVCYREKKGYRQSGDYMICNNCDQQFRSDRINETKGGCNPAPIHRTVVGGNLVIAEAELVKGAWYFQ